MNYTASFFASRRAAALDSARVMVPWIIGLTGPHSVIDVGCGTGTWASVFQRCGIDDVTGVDGAWVPQEQLEIPRERFLRVDFTKPIRLPRRYDLVVSLEVAEHLPIANAAQFVASLVSLGPLILFSAAAPQQGGVGHVNEQRPAYWIELFQATSYRCVDCVRGRFWDDAAVAPWYSQNAFFFVAEDAMRKYSALLAQENEHSLGRKAVVHPRQYFRKIDELRDPRTYSVKGFFRAIPFHLRRFLAVRLGVASHK
jgi:SAM-dependent methyltransferase